MIRHYMVFAFTVLFIMVSCQQSDNITNRNNGEKIAPTSNSKVLAKVNGVPIYEEELKNSTLNGAIRDEMIYQEGLRLGYDKFYEKRIQNFKKNIIRNKLKAEVVREHLLNNPVEKDSEKLQKLTRDKIEEYTDVLMFRATTTDKSIAENLQAQAVRSNNLESAAKQFGEDVKFQKVERSKASIDFLDTVEENVISDVVEENNKFEIYQVISVEQKAIEQIKRSASLKLEAKKKLEAVNKLIDKLENSGNYEVVIME